MNTKSTAQYNKTELFTMADFNTAYQSASWVALNSTWKCILCVENMQSTTRTSRSESKPRHSCISLLQPTAGTPFRTYRSENHHKLWIRNELCSFNFPVREAILIKLWQIRSYDTITGRVFFSHSVLIIQYAEKTRDQNSQIIAEN